MSPHACAPPHASVAAVSWISAADGQILVSLVERKNADACAAAAVAPMTAKSSAVACVDAPEADA